MTAGVWFFDNIFSDDELAYLRSQFRLVRQYIEPRSDLSEWMFKKCLPSLETIDKSIYATYPHVTFSRHRSAIGRHTDILHDDERYKVGVYLNDLTRGGTVFYTPDEVLIPHRKGRVVVFDMNIPHAGESLEKGEIKYMIGFRVK